MSLTLERNHEARMNNNVNGNGNGQSQNSFEQLLDDYEYPQPKRGQILKGRIIRIEDDIVLLDVGAKRDAMVPYDEVDQLGEELLESLSRGDEFPVYVTRTPVGEENLLVSLERGLEQQDWERAERCQENDETVELEIVNYNKGGFIVAFGRIQGFVPNSHVPSLRHSHNRDKQIALKAKRVGETLPLKIIEIDRQRERLVLSATAAQKELRKARLRELTEGQVIEGTVVHLTNYGAFVDLGHGVTGLLHVSRIAWEHIERPEDVLDIGDDVEVLIDNIDLERERVSLNRKALLPGPWEQFAQKHEVGELIEGEVTAATDFGVFVRLPAGVEGLVHVSEMDMARASKPEDVLKPGDQVLVRIISIDPDQQRLGLSRSRVTTEEEIHWMAMHQLPQEEEEEEEQEEVETEEAAEADVDAETEAEAETAVVDAEEEETDKETEEEVEEATAEETELSAAAEASEESEETAVAEPTSDSEEAPDEASETEEAAEEEEDQAYPDAEEEEVPA